MKDFKFSKEEYLFILKEMLFNEPKKEREIFELWYRGYSNVNIAKKIGVSESTIRNRKKKLYIKIKNFLNSNGKICKKYYVYKHTFPNSKIYIGFTEDIKERWANGRGYILNKEMFEDIIKYGWDNIKHEILYEFIDSFEAIKKENELILEYKSYLSEYGYNTKVSMKGAKNEN